MSKNVHLSHGTAAPGGAKESPPKKDAPPGAPRESPLANVPRPALIGGGIALVVLLLASLWFLFGVGPEDSGKAAEAATNNPPAAAAGGAPTASSAGAVSDTSPGGNASASMPTPGATGQPNLSGNGTSGTSSTASSGATASTAASAANPIVPGKPPVEVEGSPPANSHAGDGSTWKPGDAPGKVYRHGPASDP